MANLCRACKEPSARRAETSLKRNSHDAPAMAMAPLVPALALRLATMCVHFLSLQSMEEMGDLKLKIVRITLGVGQVIKG